MAVLGKKSEHARRFHTPGRQAAHPCGFGFRPSLLLDARSRHQISLGRVSPRTRRAKLVIRNSDFSHFGNFWVIIM